MGAQGDPVPTAGVQRQHVVPGIDVPGHDEQQIGLAIDENVLRLENQAMRQRMLLNDMEAEFKKRKAEMSSGEKQMLRARIDQGLQQVAKIEQRVEAVKRGR